MPLTLSAAAGDGVTAAAWRVNVGLPDSGTTINVNGSYQAPLIVAGVATGQAMNAIVNFSNTVTSPGVPGSGTNYWICQVNTSGTLSVVSSTSAMPSPSTGNFVVFQQSIASTASSAPSQQGNLAFPWQ